MSAPSEAPHILDPIPVLYGRDAELGILRACIDAAISGRGQLVLISGQAGIGKTSLTQAALDAVPDGVIVLKGSSYDLGVTPPYGPWIELLRAYEPGGNLPRFPAIARSRDGLESMGSTQAILDDVMQFLTDVSASRSLVLVLEDAHWADHASVELLRYLARLILPLRVLIIVTYREDELTVGDPLHLVLPLLVRETHATRIMLRPLGEEHVRKLVDDRFLLSEGDAVRLTEWLVRLGGGNPFFIGELLQTLEYEGTVHPDGERWRLGDLESVQAPALILQLIESRLDRVSAGTHELLQVASVIGLEVPIDLWAHVSQVTDDVLAEAITQAQAARLIDEARGRPSFVFRHALIREALYYSIVLPRRRTLHRQVAEALAQQSSPDADELAHHFHHARDARAAEWFVQAGVRAAHQFAWRTAADRFRLALDWVERDGGRQVAAGWLLYFIGMLSRRLSLNESTRALERALVLADECGDTQLTGLVTTGIGLMHCIQGRIAQGLEGIETGIRIQKQYVAQVPEQSTDEDRVRSLLRTILPDPDGRHGTLVNWLALTGHFENAIARGEALIPRIPPTHTQIRFDEYVAVFVGLGHAYLALGRPDDALEAFERAHFHSSIETLPWMYYRSVMSCVSLYWLDQEEVRERVWAMMSEAWSRASGYFSPNIRRGYRIEQYLLGEWDDAEDAALASLADGSPSVGRIATRTVLAYIYWHRGDLDRAREQLLLVRTEHNLDTFGEVWFAAAVRMYELEAQLSLSQGDLIAADAAIERHGAWLDWGNAVAWRADHQLLLAARAEAAGDLGTAIEHAREAVRLAEEPRQPLALLHGHRLLARVEISRSRYSDASSHLQAALDLARACEVPIELALTQIVEAQLAVASGSIEAAHAPVAAARKTCERLRARPALDQIADLESRLMGRAGSARARGGLSERELEVLRLVAQGLSDAEVAERLFISRRTVSGHLQSIYNKLGVTSRTAAAAFAFENQLV